jgi:hypothetical protein
MSRWDKVRENPHFVGGYAAGTANGRERPSHDLLPADRCAPAKRRANGGPRFDNRLTL